MNNITDFDRSRRAAALQDWVEQCRSELNAAHRYPDIGFDSDIWPIRSKYKTKMEDINLAPALNAFAGLDHTYSEAIRCMAAEQAIADKKKTLRADLMAWRLLGRTGLPSLLDLQRSHLQALEKIVVEGCESHPSSGFHAFWRLNRLVRFVGRLGCIRVIEPPSWRVAHETRTELTRLYSDHHRQFKEQKASILDRQIEALSDAMAAMLRGDERISAYDRAALATMGVMMCAPARVNEPLCMSVNDVFTLEDYAQRREGQEGSDELGRTHMLLLQKGSKGADWGAKPALHFMIALLTRCVAVLKDGGKRSRMLAEWYELNPTKLYLPPALEHYRGQMIDRAALAQIMNLKETPPTHIEENHTYLIWGEIRAAGKLRTIPNPRPYRSDGRKTNQPIVEAVAWADLEPILLRRVDEALEGVRRVTKGNHYQGRISPMLMLFDTTDTPYLPGAIKSGTLSARFKQTQAKREYYRKRGGAHHPTIFEKLGLTLVVDGKEEYAWIDTHDPRRWLTTQALEAKERLSDVLINKWANRLSLDQLKHYDLRSDTQKADQAAMPAVAELADLSAGLQQIEGIEAQYGLKSEIVIAHEAGVSVTSMEAIASAVEDRPVARTSNQIIIVYPSRFGVCLHQHHETPCRAYTSCLPCSENLVVKGHLPTNEDVRKRCELLTTSIVSQLERLVTAHNRQIADSPEGLEAHMLTLVRQGLTAEQRADELIDQFHEIKDRIKSPCFRSKLEEAFVARGMVQRLDDPGVASGALIHYHNPARHASPGHERALEAHGGRASIDARIEQFHREHPQFAPTSLGLQDERERLEAGEEEDDD
jgi:hypothetical protein